LRWGALSAAFVLSCSGHSGSAQSGDAASTEGGATDAGGDGATKPKDGAVRGDGVASSSGDAHGGQTCTPKLPQLTWTSPYAGWTRGVPSDPSFFPIAVWLQGSWHATELAGLGINIYVGNNAGVDPLAASDLATLKAAGIYAIIGQDSVGLANIDDTTVVGWWMTPDEPDNAQPVDGGYGPPVSPSTLVTQYEAYKKADPTRPIWLGLGQGVAYDGWEGRGSDAPAESGYPAASDIVAFDIYPYNNCGGDTNEKVTCGEFWLNAFGVDRLHEWSTRGQAVWTDFETTVISAGSTAGPTPAQTASEVWLALIHGANGVTYFIDTWNPSFREDGIFASAAMVKAVTALNAQIKSLAPVLNSATVPHIVTASTSDSSVPIDTLVKVSGTSIYVFSAVSRTGTATGSFTIAGMTGDAVAAVVGEGRTVPVKAGSFSDAFAANGVHIYSIDLATATCP
jgi:hypothetical protein